MKISTLSLKICQICSFLGPFSQLCTFSAPFWAFSALFWASSTPLLCLFRLFLFAASLGADLHLFHPIFTVFLQHLRRFFSAPKFPKAAFSSRPNTKLSKIHSFARKKRFLIHKRSRVRKKNRFHPKYFSGTFTSITSSHGWREKEETGQNGFKNHVFCHRHGPSRNIFFS